MPKKSFIIRQANEQDKDIIWGILEHAIQKRKLDGSNQWQDGYPNLDVISRDIGKNAGYVLCEENQVIGYCAIFNSEEPEYEKIEGKWLSYESFLVFHRVAIAKTHLGKGLAQYLIKHIEKIADQMNIYSIKADTNFDNYAMLKIFKNLGYTYCGEVTFRGSKRKAFEKLLKRVN